jgi:hypothetical protein
LRPALCCFFCLACSSKLKMAAIFFPKLLLTFNGLHGVISQKIQLSFLGCFLIYMAILAVLRIFHGAKWEDNDRLCGLVVRVPDYISRGSGFVSRRYQIFWEVVGLELGPLSLMRITEELLELISSGSGLENPRLTAVEIRCADHAIRSINKSWH